jgi:hypothetical protein
MIDFTETLADNVSSKVRQLDLQKVILNTNIYLEKRNSIIVN